MKLRNKKTGTIYKIEDIDLGNNADGIWLGMTKYNSLAELNEEWEDYEEPKGYWSYDTFENDVSFNSISNEDDRKADQEIGNYFETREEAEKAVKKLKAWKRLKDKGFRFKGLGMDSWDRDDIKYEINLPENLDERAECQEIKDLDLLFGGEE